MEKTRVLLLVILWFEYVICWAGSPSRQTLFQGKHHYYQNVSTASPVVQRREIPLDLLQELNDIDDLSDFITNFVDQGSLKNATVMTEPEILSNRFGGADERKSVQIPKQAACIPELKVISLRSSEDPSLFFYPFCTRIEQCGGCCGSVLLSCQPSQTEIVNFQVVVTEYKGGKQMQFKAKEIVPVERHTKCKCDCVVKEKDCNQFQEYRKNECRCVCMNVDDQDKCMADNETKIWDPMSCTCECRETKECTTGFYFDQNICSCVQIPRSRNPFESRLRRGQIEGK